MIHFVTARGEPPTAATASLDKHHDTMDVPVFTGYRALASVLAELNASNDWLISRWAWKHREPQRINQ